MQAYIVFSIAHFHDGITWRQLPEFNSIFLSNSNFVIPVGEI